MFAYDVHRASRFGEDLASGDPGVLAPARQPSLTGSHATCLSRLYEEGKANLVRAKQAGSYSSWLRPMPTAAIGLHPHHQGTIWPGTWVTTTILRSWMPWPYYMKS